MARRKNSRRNEDLKDFAGPDADKEAIERLSQAAAKDNAKAGHNSGEVPDEVYARNITLIKAALLELDELLAEVSKKRGVLGSRKKVAKKDGCDIDAIMLGLKLEKRAKAGGNAPIVAEHRNIGRVLKILDVPLYHQFKLFDLDAAPEKPKTDDELMAEAQLQGEQAGLNGEPKDNNPHWNRPGSPQFFGWNNGWQIGADKLTDSFASGKAPEPAGTAAH